MLDRILVPLDGSARAESILPQVRRLSAGRPAEIVLLRVVEPFPADFHLGIPGTPDAAGYVNGLARSLSGESCRVRGLVRTGTPAATILDTARAERAGAIALSTHAREGLARWVFGSVAEELLARSELPVLVLKAPSPGDPPPPVTPFHRILFPTDGSPASLAILPQIVSMAGPIDAVVTLLQVHAPGPLPNAWPDEDPPVKGAEARLREACVVTRFRERFGSPADEITAEAFEGAADLVAMATHGRSGPGRWIFGSVTTEVLHRSPVPMLVVSAPSSRNRSHPG
jgi:nucleotide-binding universal stress UspA family protein